ncbi:uncharacterized protein J7T55_003099 [Diaporthe amygdali]|uniref:uncharacterized protein n=1 Tax=Phomopsis amygdali TaxID=1214568 RepID=UPI0022FEA10D|nr:uncharacterized protein J7T55_003099 [Diaporthe amygdali]KAJ0122585.1 uncharacterized protein J7T55_003099 [Diaporthe amygdali]
MNETRDPAILAVLPHGCEVVSVNAHGIGSWSTGYKVEVESEGKDLVYFLKIIRRPRHLELAKGEYESQAELLKYLPDNAAIPLAYGPLELDSSASFFLTPFRNLSDKVPEPVQLAEVLEKLHKTSASPTGQFGFHTTTFNGIVPLVNECIRGPDPEMDEIAGEFFEKVIPRLLRPLQTGGRSIQPVLVHGDVWPGNVQIDRDTQRVILFDSCCCYAHNELDLGMMREPRYRFTGEHASKYLEAASPSQPEKDFDDRNAVYAMQVRDNIINAGLHEHRAFLRQLVKEEMKRLIAKHPKGIDGFEEVHRGHSQHSVFCHESAKGCI